MNDTAHAFDTPEEQDAFRLLALKGALYLETKGMTRRGTSAYTLIKKEFGLKGSKQAVFDLYVQLLKDKGILRP